MAKIPKDFLEESLKQGYFPSNVDINEFITYSPDENFIQKVNENKFTSDRQIVDDLLPGGTGETDSYENVLTDEDGKMRTYQITEDKATGQVLNKQLKYDTDGITLDDAIQHPEKNPVYSLYKKKELYEKIRQSMTSDGYIDAKKSFSESAFLSNNMFALTNLVGKALGGEKSTARYGVDDAFLNKLVFKPDGLYYADTKLNLSGEEARIFNDYFTKRTGTGGDFLETFGSSVVSLGMDYPLFMLGGGVAAKTATSVLPGIATATGIGGRLLNHVISNVVTMEIASAPSMVQNAMNSNDAADALLHDLQKNAEFGVLAGSFGTIGESSGIGISKLLNKPKALRFNEAVNFLRRNPAIVKQLSGGFTSGMLGYTTTDGSAEDKLATGLTFAALHFANPDAWRTWVKGKVVGDERIYNPESKKIMVEKDNFEVVKRLVSQGKTLEEAIEMTKSQSPRYLVNEGGKLFEIDAEDFVTKGEVNKREGLEIPLTKENVSNYKYITETIPYHKKTMMQALREGKISVLAEGIYKNTLNKVKNPYEKDTKEYDAFEWNKIQSANAMATTIYANKLNGLFKKYQLPDNVELRQEVTDYANSVKVDPLRIEYFLKENIGDYIKDPKKYDPKLQGEYAKKFNKLFESTAENTKGEVLVDMISNPDAGLNTKYPEKLEDIGDLRDLLWEVLPKPEFVITDRRGGEFVETAPKVKLIGEKEQEPAELIVNPQQIHDQIVRTEDNMRQAELDKNENAWNKAFKEREGYIQKYNKSGVETRIIDPVKLSETAYIIEGMRDFYAKQGADAKGWLNELNKLRNEWQDINVIKGEKRNAFEEGIQQKSNLGEYKGTGEIGETTQTSSSNSTERSGRMGEEKVSDEEVSQPVSEEIIEPTYQEKLEARTQPMASQEEVKEVFNQAKEISYSDIAKRIDEIKKELYDKYGEYITDSALHTTGGVEKIAEADKGLVTEYNELNTLEHRLRPTKPRGTYAVLLPNGTAITSSTAKSHADLFTEFPSEMEEAMKTGEGLKSGWVKEGKFVNEKGETIEPKNIADVTTVSTPEKRRSFLMKKVYSPEDSKYDESLAERIKEATTTSSNIPDFAKKLGLPKHLDFVWEILDKLGYKNIDISKISPDKGKSGSTSAWVDLEGNSLNINKRIWLSNTKYSNEFRSNRELPHTLEGLTNVLVHEAIHPLLEKPELVEKYKLQDLLGNMKYLHQYSETILRDDLNTLKSEGNAGKYSQILKEIGYGMNRPNFKNWTTSEFVAEALSNPYFAEYLNRIDLPANANIEKPTTVWGRFLDSIKRLYERITNTKGSVLDRIVDDLDTTFRDRGLIGVNDIVIPVKDAVNELRQTGKELPLSENVENLGNVPNFTGENERKEAQVESKIETGMNIPPENLESPQTKLKTNFAPKEKVFKNQAEKIKYEAEKKTIANQYGDDFSNRYESSKPKIRYTTKVADVDPDQRETPSKIEQVVDYAKIEAERAKLDFDEAKTSKLVDLSPQGFKKFISNQKILDVKEMMNRYWKYNTPPAFKALWSPKFKDEVYTPGEQMIRSVPYETNRILRQLDGWNSAISWRLMKKETPEIASHYLNAFKNYEYGRYTGDIKQDMTWGEFADTYKLSATERKHLDILRNTQKMAIDVLKDMRKKYMIDLDKNLTNYLNKKEMKKFFGDDYEKSNTNWNKELNDNPAKKTEVAEFIIDKEYGEWGRHVHYNAIRPIDPSTYIVQLLKPNAKFDTKVTNEQGEVVTVPGNEQIYTYFTEKNQAENYINEMTSRGWGDPRQGTGEFYRIKDTLSDSSYWNRLNAHQIMELANKGHIPLNDKVIQHLLEITQKGVDLHKIHKTYVPGMKYTPDEYEEQLNRFARESVSGSVKPYYLTQISNNLRKWEEDLSPMIRSGVDPEKVKDLKAEFLYARGYNNQLRSPESSAIDGLRGLTIAMQVGAIKPSFLFQQATQPIQTTLTRIQQVLDKEKFEDLPGGIGTSMKMLSSAYTQSVQAGLALRAIDKGLPLDAFDAKTIDLAKQLKELSLMNKIGSVGTEELYGLGGDVDWHYGSKKYRIQQGFLKSMSILGKGVEKWTRVVSAIPFYEIGIKKGLTGKELTNYIATNIDLTMSEWGKGGRAPLLDSKGEIPSNHPVVNALKKSVMTYKTFPFYNWGMWQSLVKNRQWSAFTTKAMVGFGLHGLTKFPLIATMIGIADLFSDEDMDYKMWKASDALDEILPMKMGSVFHRGMGAWANLDLRQTFGEDTPLLTDLYADAWSKTWDAKVQEIGLGAPYGFIKDMATASVGFKEIVFDAIDGNNISTDAEKAKAKKMLLKMAPVSLRNVFTSMQYNDDGIEVQGKKMVTREDLDAMDIAFKALSFPIEKQTRAYDDATEGEEAQYNRAQHIINEARTFIKETRARSEDQMTSEQKGQEIRKALQEIKAQEILKNELEPKVKQLKRLRR